MSAPAFLPHKTTGLDSAFGPSSIKDFLPAFSSLPGEFQRGHHRWCWFVSGWFYSGLPKDVVDGLKTRESVDKDKALRHIDVCLRSFEPSHEHKIGGCGYLASIWFEGEPPTWDAYARRVG